MGFQWASTLVLALLSLHQASACLYVFGGEETFTLLGASLGKLSGVHGFGPPGSDVDLPYLPSSSDAAVMRFNNGTLCLAVSDYPMTDYRSTWGTTRRPGKYTIPLAFSAYGFFISSQANIELDATQTFQIYQNQKAKWEDFTDGGLTGTIVKFARKDSSATNYIVRKFWCTAGVHCDRFQDERPFSFKNTIYVEGSYALAMQAVDVPGAILYSQIGVATRISGLTEVAIKNLDGNFVKASDSSSVPPVLKYPKFQNRWSRLETVYQPGPSTPPLISLMVAFIAQRPIPIDDQQWKKAVKVLDTVLKTPPQRLAFYRYLGVPSTVQTSAAQLAGTLV